LYILYEARFNFEPQLWKRELLD